jgi:hypothetical protein
MVVVSVAVLDEAFRRLKQVGTFREPIGVASAFCYRMVLRHLPRSSNDE